MTDINAQWEWVSRLIFQKAMDENRCGELLTCLFDGGSATVEPGVGLVLITAEQAKELHAVDINRARGGIES